MPTTKRHHLPSQVRDRSMHLARYVGTSSSSHSLTLSFHLILLLMLRSNAAQHGQGELEWGRCWPRTVLGSMSLQLQPARDDSSWDWVLTQLGRYTALTPPSLVSHGDAPLLESNRYTKPYTPENWSFDQVTWAAIKTLRENHTLTRSILPAPMTPILYLAQRTAVLPYGTLTQHAHSTLEKLSSRGGYPGAPGQGHPWCEEQCSAMPWSL